MKDNQHQMARGGRHYEPAVFHGQIFSVVAFPLGFLLL